MPDSAAKEGELDASMEASGRRRSEKLEGVRVMVVELSSDPRNPAALTATFRLSDEPDSEPFRLFVTDKQCAKLSRFFQSEAEIEATVDRDEDGRITGGVVDKVITNPTRRSLRRFVPK